VIGVALAVSALWLLTLQNPPAQSVSPVETFDRAWTIVRDTHFDPGMNGVDWDAVRTELRPRAVGASDTGELRAVIREMLARLEQSHFALVASTPDSAGEPGVDASGDPGFEIRPAGRDVLVTSVPAAGGGASAGVRPGWRLLTIQGVSVAEILGTLDAAVPERLWKVEAWRAIENRLRGPAGSSAAVTFEDGEGRPVSLAVPRRPEQGEPVTIGNLPMMHVRVQAEKRRTPAGALAGLIRFNVWMPAVDAHVQRAMDDFRAADGIVIDLRGNPGGLAAMMMGISGHFVTERKPLGVMKTRDSELTFAANPRLVSGDGKRVQPFAGPVAILVDSMSGSATECFAGGMQAIRRARVFGETSMGQALPALFDRLPNGDLLIHAYGDFITADGTRLEGRGVIPDEMVPLRREDLLAGRDGPLDAALAWIDRSRLPAGDERR
jgi:carboxyl-terminal processing protease